MIQPTDHHLLAAVRVARILDPNGSSLRDVEASFPLVLSQGEHRTEDLRIGLAVLLDAELAFESLTGFLGTARLTALAALGDQAAVQQLRRHLSTMTRETDRAVVGAQGEAAIVEACRAELVELGRPDLANDVIQVSLFDDSLGYDISAPSFAQGPRQLEVKTTSTPGQSVFTFYLSRNEYDVGCRNSRSWSLVACELTGDDASSIGWCRASALAPYLPDDRRGRWTEALVRIPRSLLFEGIPPCV